MCFGQLRPELARLWSAASQGCFSSAALPASFSEGATQIIIHSFHGPWPPGVFQTDAPGTWKCQRGRRINRPGNDSIHSGAKHLGNRPVALLKTRWEYKQT